MFALPSGVHNPKSNATWGEALKVLRHDHKLHQLLAANLAIGLVFMQVTSAFALYVMQLGFSTAVYGALISINGLMVVLVELPLTTITRRFPAQRVIALGYLVNGMGFALNYFAHNILGLVACVIIFTLGEMLIMPMASAYIANLAPAHMRGRYLGVSGLTWSLALIIGPGPGNEIIHAQRNVVLAVVRCSERGGCGDHPHNRQAPV